LKLTHRLPILAVLLGTAACLLGGGCATEQPAPLTVRELAEAQTFPFYRVYWVGSRFGSYRLVAADGRNNYISSIGDSVYYGDCVPGKTTALGGGGCELPLQVTTLIYTRHANAPLGPQRNTVLRGVPAVIFDGGHSIELYSGRVAIDVFSDTFAHAQAAANELLPLNAPGFATGNLPPPVYCPGLSGPQDAQVRGVMERLPGRACQQADAAAAFANSLA
jgi:hypothetical protein